MELGSKLRSEEEEEALQSLLPILSGLAEFNSNEHRTRTISNGGTDAGIADMSGYAMALIASRKAQERNEEVAPKVAPSKIDRVRILIQEAREDLESTQAPIRARAMVSLGRLARGYLGILQPGKDNQRKLVEELGNDRSSEENLIEFTVQEVLRLSMSALSDDESYVYLAAVQTIVAMGDLQPTKVLPRIGASIVTGKFDVDGIEFSISNEQRIKLGEALIFIIRRRAAPSEYLPHLMNLMIFGSVERIGTVGGSAATTYDQNNILAIETDNYFLATEEADSTVIVTKEEKWNEQDIRAKTGGPIFAVEEQDLVRSLRLSIMAELASVVPPATLAPYCRMLIRLMTDVLRLDDARTACRAAALLAREFYGCLLREQVELSALVDGNQHGNSPLQLAVAIVAYEHDEDILVKTLQNHSTGRERFGGGRINDLAVRTRSQEALALRDDGEDVLEVARLIDATQLKGDLPSILSLMKNNRN